MNAIVLNIQTTETGSYTTDGNLNIINTTIPILKYYPQEASKTDVYLVDPMVTESATLSLLNIDTINKKLSGTFNFTGYKLNSIETVEIENGIFNNIPFVNEIPEDLSNGNGLVHFNGIVNLFDNNNDYDLELITERIQLKHYDFIELTFLNPYSFPNAEGYYTADNPAIKLHFPTNASVGNHNVLTSNDYSYSMPLTNNDTAILTSSSIEITNNNPQSRTITGIFKAFYESQSEDFIYYYVIDELSEFNITYEE